MAVDLIFSQLPITGQPVALVFGDEDAPSVVDAVTVSCTITLPSLRGSVGLVVGVPVACAITLPGLSGSVGIIYSSGTARPEVYQARSLAAVARVVEGGIAQPEHHAAKTTTGVQAPWTDAQAARESIAVDYQEGQPVELATLSGFADGVPTQAAQLTGRMQEGHAQWLRFYSQFHVADRLTASRLSGRFQDGLRDRRAQVQSHFQEASRRTALRYRGTAKPGVPVVFWRAGRFQEAQVPPPGIYVPPVIPPVVIVRDGHLLFQCPPLLYPALVFGALPCYPATDGAPLRILPARFYMVVHNVFAQRLPDLADVPIFDVSVAADEDSYCWTLQASAPGSVFDLLFPADGVPAQLLLTMDGIEWVFAIDPPDDDWEFAKTRTTIHGRSVTALASSWSPSTRSNSMDMTAQQIALDALAGTGIDLDWGIGAGALANAGLVDWMVPAGAWSHRGTPLDAVQTVVAAAGGHLQSHRTAAKLLARHPYGQRIGDVSGAPWAWDTGAPDVELAQDVVLNQGRRYKTLAGINAAYISGTSYGLLALVKRAGTAGNKLGEMVVDQLITHVDAARQRGLSIIGPSSGMFYDPVLELPVLTGPGRPGVLEVGQVVQVNANVPWRGRVRSVSARYKRPTLRQTVVMERYFENTGATMHSAGMTSSTNIFRALRDLIPEAPRQVATVSAVHTATGDSTITWPEGSQQRVLGTSVPAGSKAFVRGGLIEGAAPDLPFVTIDV